MELTFAIDSRRLWGGVGVAATVSLSSNLSRTMTESAVVHAVLSRCFMPGITAILNI